MKLQQAETTNYRARGCALGRYVIPLLETEQDRAMLRAWLDDPDRSAAKIAGDLNMHLANEGLALRLNHQTIRQHRRGLCSCAQ